MGLTNTQILKAQGYIEASTYLGGSNFDYDNKMIVSNGESYIFGQSASVDFTRTLGSLYGGGAYDATLTKLDANGNVLWSRFIGGNGTDYPTDIMVSNGLVFVAINTTSTNFPVTDGSTKTGAAVDNNSAFAVLNAATGTIQFSSYLGKGYPQDIAIEGNNVYIYGNEDLGGTQGYQLQLVNYDIASNTIVYNKNYGGSGIESTGEQINNNKIIQVANGKVYLAGATYSSNFPVTDGSTLAGTFDHVYLKVNGSTGNIEFATYYGGAAATLNYGVLDLRIDNSGVYILGLTNDIDFPVTDGSSKKGSDDFYLRKYDINTNALVYSKLIGSIGVEQFATMEIENGTVYLAGELYSSTGYPHTYLPGSYTGASHLFYTKLNANTGNITYSTWIHSNRSEYFGDFAVQDGVIYLQGMMSGGSAASITYPITNGSTKNGASDELVITKINANNQICYSSFLGGPSDELANNIQVVNESIYIAGNTSGNAYPVTNTITKKTSNDFIWTKLNLNPDLTSTTDNVTPSTQTVCRNGLATLLTAPAITFPADSMPIIYRNAVPSNQTAIDIKYQWQQSSSASGPWTDIPGAIQLNYTPQVGLVDVYYRRLANSSVCGSSTPISTSSVASILVNANTAPSVTVGNVVNTCVGSTVLLGGSPTATANGGASIVSYLWTPSGTYTPNDAVANPTITATGTTIYNVLVTDNNGCQQIGQQLVNAYAANAGGNKSACNGQAVRIGSAPIAGLAGVTYSWASSPADPTMSCTTCAQPDVNPTAATTYTLTLTIPITGGGTCSTTSTCVVTPVAAPVTPNFAGPDVVICAGSTATLGTASESGFTYTWAPGNYLVTNNTAQVTFQPGSLSMPNPNPITYFVTASKSGCSFVDQTVAAVIEARAAQDGCGPRMLGEGDRTPNINETYLWTKISGDGNIIGANNTPQIQVGATTSGNTVYELSVTYNGTTCTDQVIVPTCGCPVPNIAVEAPNSCASYSLNGGSVALTATSLINCTYTWSPAAGLSSTTGQTVYLTDNVSRTYTVTATSVVDPSFFCTNSRTVNNPAWSLPVFTAKDTIVCPSDAITIGQAPVAGYDYLWSGNVSLLSATNASNPTATVSSTNEFPVLVTDIGSGCTKRDTATVTILGLPANVAGSDVILCGTGTVQLGQAPQPNITYIWTPATTYTPNNTSANPTVTVATTTSFTVVATNSITGCSVTDTVLVTVNPAVAAFSFTNETFCPSTAGAMPLPAGPSGMAAYSWSPASIVLNNTSNGPTATSLATRPQTVTNYILTITNAQGCTQAAQVTFTPSVSIPATGGNKTICTGASAQLGGPAESGATYTWSSNPVAGNAFFSSTSASNPTFAPTTAGIYTLTVSKTDVGGCITTATSTVVVNSFTLPTIASPTVCQNTCVGIGTNLITPGAQYFWSPAAGLSDATISNPIACVTNSSVTYTLTAIAANGCVDTRSVVVGVNPSPSPTITIPTLTPCLSDVTAVINPSISPAGSYSYQWFPNNGTLSNVYISNPTVNLTGLGTQTYSLTVTDNLTGCAGNAVATVNVQYCPPPCVLSTIPPLTVAGLSFGSGSAPLSENVTLNAGANVLPENNIGGFNFSSSSEGTFYTLCTEISQGILPLQNPYTHEFNGSGNGFTAMQALHIAQIFQASGFNSTTGFGAGNNTVLNFVALQMAVWNAMYDADYSVTAGPFQQLTDANGARALANTWLNAAQNIATPSVVVHRLHNSTGQDLVKIGDVPPITINPIAPSCLGNFGGLIINGFSNGQRYQYSTGSTFNSGGAIPVGITVIPSGGVIVSNLANINQVYTVRVYDASDNDCYTDRIVNINQVDCCIKPDADTNQTACKNTSSLLIGKMPSTGTWSSMVGNPIGATLGPTIGGEAIVSFDNSAFGTYGFIYNIGGSCQDTMNIEVGLPPTADAGSTQNLNCTTTSATIGTTAVVGNTYSWSPSLGLNDSTIAQPTANPTATTTYTVTVTGANGCQATSTVMVNVNTTVPTADAGSTQNLDCTTTSATIGTASISGNTYSWSPSTGLSATNIAQPTANPTATTTYTVTVTGANGCQATSTVMVNVNTTAPAADAGSTQNLNCTTTSATIGTTAVVGNTYSWSPSLGLNNSTIAQPTANPTATTTYTVTVTGANGCQATSTVMVNVNTTAPTADAGAVISLNCVTTSGMIGTTGIVGVDYSWSPSAGLSNSAIAQPTASPSATTTYTVTATSANGCQATSTVVVNVNGNVASIGNYVWVDLNKNGTNDEPSTAGINGVSVELWNATTNVIANTTTTGNDLGGNPGYYSFSTCISGDYFVKFPTTIGTNNLTTQTSTAATDNNSDASPTIGNSPTFTIDVNGSGVAKDNNTIDAGYYSSACLGNYVWNDINQDGIQNNGEVGVSGVTTTLYNATTNTILATVSTDAYGFYQFCGLNPGDYKVGFSLPTNYVFTSSNTGSDDAIDSDPSNITGLTATVTLASGDSNMTVDAGIYQPQPTTATVGDRVWFDANSNGTQDGTEQGVSGVTVTLYNCANPTTPIATTITGANGNYIFENVAPGSYAVSFTAPTGTTFTTQTGTVNTTDNSDVDATGKTACFPVMAGDKITYVDAGIIPQTTGNASIGDKVWNDANQDGIQDASETGVAGVTVTLYDATGTTVIKTVTTDGLGNYGFNDLTPGCYVVGFSLPSGYTRTAQNAGTDSTKNSDANATTGMTNQICVTAGQNNPTIDAGIYNASNTNSIGDRVWYDGDKDGLQDPTEYGYPGVVVTLHNCTTDAIVGTTTTNASGNYLFDGVANGDYYVEFGFVPGFSFTAMNADVAGINGANNSDANPSNGKTACVSLTGNTHITTVDAGIYPGSNRNATSSLGDIVWLDANNNGLQDNGETGVSGVTATLLDATTNAVLATTITDGLGNYIFTNLDGGNYKVEFTNIPVGYTFTTQGTNIEDEDNNDANQTTGMTNTIPLGVGEDKMSVDAGIVAPANTVCLGDYVWIDLNNNGTQDATEPAVPGVTVKLYDNNTNTVLRVATTNSEGQYLFCGLTIGSTYSVGFENLPAGFTFTTSTGTLATTDNSDANPTTGRTTTVTMGATNDLTLDAGIYSTTTAVVGNYVWYDEDADGIQDANEAPIPGVLVTMYDNTNTAVASAVTDANGGYLFTNVTPGTYTIGFEGYPSSLVPTTKGTTNPATADDDSNIDPITGRTDAFTVTPGSSNLTLDAGYKANPIAGLGNYVWHDVNKDGLQDANEPSIAGVIVTLYAADGTTVLGTAITNGNGAYSFPNLPAGDYVVGFSNIPTGYTRTQSVGALNDALNSDINASNKTSTITLAAGTYNPNIDAGFYFGFPLPVSLVNFTATENNCQVNLAWSTTSEVNADRFEVLRKTSKEANFTFIGTVQASGNSTSMKNYRYTDKHVSNESYEYKLNIVDLDGKTAQSAVKAIQMNCTQVTGINVYPNPVNDAVNITISGSLSEVYEIKLMDMTGRTIMTTQTTMDAKVKTIQLDVHAIATGIYNISVSNANTSNVFKIQKTN